MNVLGVHFVPLTLGPISSLVEEAKRLADVFDARFVTVMSYPNQENSVDAYLQYARLANQAGEALHHANITLCYHCYSWDFSPLQRTRSRWIWVGHSS